MTWRKRKPWSGKRALTPSLKGSGVLVPLLEVPTSPLLIPPSARAPTLHRQKCGWQWPQACNNVPGKIRSQMAAGSQSDTLAAEAG